MRERRRGRFKILVLMAACVIGISAGERTAAAGTGEIRVRLKDLQTQLSEREGVPVEGYQVGTVDTFGKPVLEEKYGIGDYPQDSASLDQAAEKIFGMLEGEPLLEGKTDQGGNVTFSVEEGVYLIRVKGEDRYGTVKPFLINLPYYEEVNGELRGPLYEVEAEPKAAPPEAVVTPKPTETPKPTVPPKPTGTPGGGAETGEDSGIVWYSALAALALLGSGTAWYRRRRHV